MPELLILPLFSPFGFTIEFIKEFGGDSLSLFWPFGLTVESIKEFEGASLPLFSLFGLTVESIRGCVTSIVFTLWIHYWVHQGVWGWVNDKRKYGLGSSIQHLCFHQNNNKIRWVKCSSGIAPTSRYTIFDKNHWIVKQRKSFGIWIVLKFINRFYYVQRHVTWTSFEGVNLISKWHFFAHVFGGVKLDWNSSHTLPNHFHFVVHK